MSSDRQPGVPPTFILSTGRAGSKMLARALAHAPSLFAVHEPLPHLVTEGYLKWTGRLSPEEAEQLVQRRRGDLVRQVETNGLIYVESSHYCSHFIRELDRLFDARFIFLHREPRGFTQSGLARNWYDEPSPRQRLYTLARRKWVVDIGNFWYDHRLDPPPELTTRMERLAWLWSEINRTIMDGLEEIEPSRKMEVRLDSVGPATFSEVLRFIGVPDDEELTERMALTAARKPNKTLVRPDEVAPWDDEAFERLTREVSTRLGYVK